MDFSINNIAIVKKPLDKNKQAISEEKLPVEHAKTLPMPLYHPNKYMVNFKGLTREMKKTAYKDSYEIKLKMQEHASSKGVIGSLPYEWIEKIPYKKREENIKELYASMKTITKDLRYSEDAQKSSDAITEAFQKAGIITKEEKLNLKYLNEGAFGAAYKLEGIGQKDEYVIKVYMSDNENGYMHGNYVENARAAFWQEKAGTKTGRVKFFFGDMESGYMVNKFIGDSVPETKKVTNPKKYGLDHDDEAETSDGHNKIRGYAIDFGGFEVENPVLTKNQVARNIYEKMFDSPRQERIDLFKKLYKLKNDEINVGLAASLKLLPDEEAQDYFKQFALSDNKKVIEALAYNLDIMESDELNSYFKTWSEKYKDDENVKKALISNFDNYKLKIINKIDSFNIFAQNASQEIKIGLIKNIHIQTTVGRLKCFEEFSIGASDALKEAMINNINALCGDLQDCAHFYEKFAQDADKNENIKIALINNMSVLSEEKREEWFKIFAQNADEKIKLALSNKLCCLPYDKLAYFEDFAKDAGPKLKIALIEENLERLPKEKAEEWFGKFAQNADEKIKYELIDKINVLDKEKRSLYAIKLVDNANFKVKKRLSHFLKYFPENEVKDVLKAIFNNTDNGFKQDVINVLQYKSRSDNDYLNFYKEALKELENEKK